MLPLQRRRHVVAGPAGWFLGDSRGGHCLGSRRNNATSDDQALRAAAVKEYGRGDATSETSAELVIAAANWEQSQAE